MALHDGNAKLTIAARDAARKICLNVNASFDFMDGHLLARGQ
jgi:hypothetical protein